MKNKPMKARTKDILLDIGYLVISGVLFGMAYNIFFVPGAIFIGGAGGIATALNYLYGLPTGTMILLINIPLVLLFMYFYGVKFSVKAIIGTMVSSVFVDGTAMLGIFEGIFPAAKENKLMCAILGGLILGVATAFMFSRGYSTGGSDLLAFVVKVFVPKIKIPTLILIIDGFIIIGAALMTDSGYMGVFFSVLTSFMISNSLTIVNGSFDKTKIAYIFSSKYHEIADAMMEKLNRGVTLLDAQGWYSKEDKKVIFCVVKKNETFAVKELVQDIDDKAFMILAEGSETIGEGFKTCFSELVIEPKEHHKKRQKKKSLPTSETEEKDK